MVPVEFCQLRAAYWREVLRVKEQHEPSAGEIG